MLTFIISGGTIDSYYDTDMCTVIPHEKTRVLEYLKDVVTMDISNIHFEELCMKDSRQINNQDRNNMVEYIEKSEHTEFVITHGTYTLFETAKYLERHLKRTDVKVTLTGSLIPLFRFSPTDAGFNLAGAIINSQVNEPGIYVYIRGEICTPNNELFLHSS